MMTLGQRIQELRKSRDLSQEALGEILGVSRQAVSRWEMDGAVPEVDKLIQMAKLFGLSLDDLLTAELLLREPGSAIRDAFDSALLLRDRCAEPAWTSVNSPALAAAAREGLGVAVLPACLTEADVAAGRLVRLEVEGLTLRNQNQLVVHRDKTITPPLRLFMEAVTAEEG